MSPSNRVVLLLTTEPAIRNLVEQVCRIDGYRTVTVVTVEEVYALSARRGKDAFGLAVIDTAALGVCDQQQQRQVFQLWQDWRATSPGLPLVFVGTMAQRQAFRKQRTGIGGFLVKPLGALALADMMRRFLLDEPCR
jgi:DNA-binding NtrC family response regulator